MSVCFCSASGRADPFGLLVLAVVLALTVTIGIQAQASARDGRFGLAPQDSCDFPSLVGDMRR